MERGAAPRIRAYLGITLIGAVALGLLTNVPPG
jgi:hypothetical protein